MFIKIYSRRSFRALVEYMQFADQWNDVAFLALTLAACNDEGAISVIDNEVIACVNGSAKSVCYGEGDNDTLYLAEAACSRRGLRLDSKRKLKPPTQT